MPEIPGASVWLEIDGVRLEEFGVERDESKKTVTCWVPCQTGKEFRFGVSLPAPRELHYRFSFCLDGTEIHGKALPKRSIRKTEDCSPGNPTYFEGQKEERGLRPFQFASVRLTDDDSHMSDVSNLGDLVVEVSTYKGLREERITRAGKGKVKTVSLGDTVVHERAKKGLTSCVQFGELRPLAPKSSASQMKGKAKTTQWLVEGLEKVGTVVFKYRQIDVLVADGIAPRPTTAAAPSINPRSSSSSIAHEGTPSQNGEGVQYVKEEATGLSDDVKLKRLKARAAALQELSEVKAEIETLESKKRTRGGEELTSREKRVKREPKTEPPPWAGEVIDLT